MMAKPKGDGKENSAPFASEITVRTTADLTSATGSTDRSDRGITGPKS